MSHKLNSEDEKLIFTVNELLDGRIRLKQPSDGYRVSMDTILLAACIPAQSNDKILEAGTGSAGAAIALAHRVEDCHITGLEVQEEMAGFAQDNVLLNHMTDRVKIIQGDVLVPPDTLKAGSFDHVFANPPYLSDGSAIRSPRKTKRLAHMEKTASLKNWINFCVNMARHKGSISFIYRADRLDELMARLYGKVGDLRLLPIRSRKGGSASRIIVQGRKGVSGAVNILPSLIIHGEGDRYTDNTDAILRGGEPLDMGTIRPMRSRRPQ